MSKLAFAAVAAALVSSAPAYAQTATGPGAAYNNFVPATGTGTFGNNGSLIGAFTNVFTFNVTTNGLLASNFSNAASSNGGASDIDFSSATLSGNGTTTSYTKVLGEPVVLNEVWEITPFAVTAGTYTLTISGNSFGDKATFAGNFNVGAVPEPATWAMMIGGIGMVGGAMRRRRVSTKVTFA